MATLQPNQTMNFLLDPAPHNHVILVYDHEADREDAISQYLNEGLRRNQLCVYASVFVRDQGHMERLASKIKNYQDHLAKGSLIVIDFTPYYIAAMSEDFSLFEGIKEMVNQKVKDRDDKYVRLAGDCVSFLFKNKHFEECLALEGWWQQKPFDGCYLCPFPKSLFESYPYSSHKHSLCVVKHDVAIDTEGKMLLAPTAGGTNK